MLLTIIKSCTEEKLLDFLRFLTGTGLETISLVPGCTVVSCTSTDVIYSSTCLMELKVRTEFQSYAHFDIHTRSVMKGQSFSTP